MVVNNFNKIYSKYIENYSIKGPWSLDKKIIKKYKFSIIIPCFSESKYIPYLFDSINKQNQKLLKKTLVVIVINNLKNSSKDIIQDNNDTIQFLKHVDVQFDFRYIDACNTNLALDEKIGGVGYARKIGSDLILDYLTNNAMMCFTDADVILSKGYLDFINNNLY